jgi:hypothetical protein
LLFQLLRIGITPVTVAIENAPMIDIAITSTNTITTTNMPIVVIGDPGTTGMTMPDNAPGFTNMADTTEREGI